MNNDLGPNVIEHYDGILGIQEDQKAWSFKEKGFWILKYENQPSKHASSYITVGLGRHLLAQESNKQIRQELIVTVWDEYAAYNPEVALTSLSFDYIERHIPIPNHQIIPWEGGVYDGLDFSAVYCIGARHMPEEFERIESDPELVFVWLVPIFSEEQAYCSERGWSDFEKLIEIQRPDFFDLKRSPLRLTK